MSAPVLLVFFSRSGHTREVAARIAARCRCDVEELHDRVGRRGVSGWARSALEAVIRFETLLEPAQRDPASYGLVIVGTPVWFWNLSSPVRTWLNRERGRLGKVAFFCTCGSSGAQRAQAEFERLAGTPVASLAITRRELGTGRDAAKIEAFVARLGSGLAAGRSAKTASTSATGTGSTRARTAAAKASRGRSGR